MSYPAGSHYHVHCIGPTAKPVQQVQATAPTIKKRLHQKVVHIPPLAAPPTLNSFSPEPLEDREAGDKADLFKDPAKLVLVKAEEAQRNRKQAETRIALEKIHGRIQCTLDDFERPVSDANKGKSDVNLEIVEDPVQLYELLSDSRLRSKYQQNLTVFIVGYEEKCETRERVLGSLQEFFEETQSGGTQTLLDELESEEIDFDDVTSGLESAMDTAQNAAERLLKIKKDMSQLIAIVAAFPDTKKGRKKMEKALLKAQEDTEQLTSSLNEVKGELEQSQEAYEQLQKQIELKTQECAKLRPLADKTKLLQVSNDSVKKEMENLQSTLKKVKEELKETKKLVPTKRDALVKATAEAVDQGKISELENQLMEERERCTNLMAEKEELTSTHQAKIESLIAEHETEIQEMRSRYEEQMKSLMEDDLFDEEKEEGDEYDSDGDERPLAEESFLRDIGEDGDGGEMDIIETTAEQPEPPTPNDLTLAHNEEMMNETTPQEREKDTASKQATPNKCAVTDTDVNVQGGEVSTDQYGVSNEQGDPLIQDQFPPHSATTTPLGTPTQRPHPSSPPTSTGSGSPAGSIAGSMKGRRMSKAVAGKVHKEFETREKKLRHDLEEVKAKSRKAVTSLKAHLAEAHSKHASEMEAVKCQLRELKENLDAVQRENATLKEQVESCRQENEGLSLSLRETEGKMKKFKTLANNLQLPLDSEMSHAKDTMATTQDGDLFQPISPQWSDRSGQLTPRSVGASPIQPMDEVYLSGNGQSLDSGSVDLTLHDGRGVQFTTSPLSQSLCSAINHAPLGSPLQSGSDGGSVRSGAIGGGVAPPIPMQYSLGMLAQSRLSHHSPGPQIGFDHPVVMEWSKAYETVIKFKENLVELLSQSPGQLAAMADDLRTLELHSLDRDGDVQGQITEMRFSLALMLHQIEQTLQDTFAEAMGATDSEETDSPRTDVLEQTDSSSVEDFKMTVAKLKTKLRDSEHSHQIEMQESKETIANLSNKVESLKIEMAKLRQSLPQNIGDSPGVELEGRANIMFTRLDAERNTKTLQGVLEKDWISSTLYQNVTSNMEDYLSIPGHRLAVMANHCRHKNITSSLLKHINTHLLDSENGSKVFREIQERERVKELQFALEMDRLTAKRTSLAHDLTHTLTHIEKKAGVFLIKPIYARSGTRRVASLITPIDRPLPLHLHPRSKAGYSQPRTSQSRPRTRHDSECSTPHPNMKLVSQLVRARQQQTQREWITPPAELSGSGSPSTYRRQLPSLHTPFMPTGEWVVGVSHVPPPAGGQDFVNPLEGDITQGPLMPRLMEMDIVGKRQPEALLGHCLPSRPASKVPPCKLNLLDDLSLTPPSDKTSPDKLKASVQFDLYPQKTVHSHTHLPPIRVPSRTNHDRSLTVH